jgi:diadenosine tetraphosphate (Ap4A) HIT family hydrolase
MRRAEALGECTFCIGTEVWGDREVINEGEYWIVTPNLFPYENTHLHLMLVTRRHIESISELSVPEAYEFMDMCRWITDTYEVEHGAIGMRFGEMSYTGATIAHLHGHFIVAEKEPPANSKRVRLAMGPKPPPE